MSPFFCFAASADITRWRCSPPSRSRGSMFKVQNSKFKVQSPSTRPPDHGTARQQDVGLPASFHVSRITHHASRIPHHPSRSTHPPANSPFFPSSPSVCLLPTISIGPPFIFAWHWITPFGDGKNSG